MKLFEWDDEKNEKLKQGRDISFEEIVFYVANGSVLDIVSHPQQNKYPGQKMFVINIDSYAYLVPFVETGEAVFLKTIILSRKATKKYLKR